MPNDPILYPLTASQGVMYYSQKYSKTKSIINICSMLHFDAEIDVNIMLQAISLGLHRNRSASIRMRKDGKGVKQYFSEQPPEAVTATKQMQSLTKTLQNGQAGNSRTVHLMFNFTHASSSKSRTRSMLYISA